MAILLFPAQLVDIDIYNTGVVRRMGIVPAFELE
jgi:hypothetical protein